MSLRKLVVILGIPIDNLDLNQALDRLEEFVRIGRATGKGHQVVTVNTDFLVNATRDPENRFLLQEADMATADGMPLVWGARLLGEPLPGRVAGADFIPLLVERAAQKGYSIYLLGAAEGIAACAAKRLKQRHPNLIIAGVSSPPKSSVYEMDPGIVEEIKSLQPDILLVAFGNPKQEKWIGMYGSQLGVPLMIGVGGTLDFIAGSKKRAPYWLQHIGLEWLFRLIQEPQRLWKRYLLDWFVFGTLFIHQWWSMRRGLSPYTSLPKTSLLVLGNNAIIGVQGHLAIDNIDEFEQAAQKAISETSFLVINLEGVEFLDSSAIGRLVGLANQARRAGGELSLVAVQPPIKETLSLLKLDKFFPIYVDLEGALKANSDLKETGVIQVRDSDLHSNDGVEWIIIRGPRRLDGLTAPQVVARLSALVREKPFMVLDLSETVSLTSAGLIGLANVTNLAKTHNGELRVFTQSKDLSNVIKMGEFDKVFSIYEDLFSATL
jgi:N-acetylglucosaminyldiphosphoundecaprenol N-acetyl-beta-D-mannosaminyltransferase